MKRIQDIVYTTPGKEEGKVNWHKAGVLIEKEDGKRSIKLDAMPVGEWDGWFSVVEQKPKEEKAEGKAAKKGDKK